MNDALLLQQASGPCKRLLAMTHERHRVYAEKFGMDYWSIFGGLDHGRHPVWDKLYWIRDALAMHYTYVFWVDADAVIVNTYEDLRPAVSSPIMAVRHPGPPEHWNLGVMLIRNHPEARAIVDDVIAHGPGVAPWYEQTIFNVIAPQYDGLIRRLDDRFNSTFGINEAPDPMISAAHGGWDVSFKTEKMRQWLDGPMRELIQQ